MKTIIKLRIYKLTIIVASLIFLTGCKKEPAGLDTVKDLEGNGYGIIKIGNQVWMTENLRVSHFSDGSGMLSRLYADYEWASAAAACAVYPDNHIDGLDTEADVVKAYGLLYNWNAVNDSRGLCPTGWRVPTDDDWNELVTYLGGEDVAGGKLKSKRTDPIDHPRWDSPNTGATDGYYFSALPGGFRSFQGWYDEVGYSATWWSSTEFDATFAVTRSIENGDGSIDRAYRHKRSGFSVRCIQE